MLQIDSCALQRGFPFPPRLVVELGQLMGFEHWTVLVPRRTTTLCSCCLQSVPCNPLLCTVSIPWQLGGCTEPLPSQQGRAHCWKEDLCQGSSQLRRRVLCTCATVGFHNVGCCPPVLRRKSHSCYTDLSKATSVFLHLLLLLWAFRLDKALFHFDSPGMLQKLSLNKHWLCCP